MAATAAGRMQRGGRLAAVLPKSFVLLCLLCASSLPVSAINISDVSLQRLLQAHSSRKLCESELCSKISANYSISIHVDDTVANTSNQSEAPNSVVATTLVTDEPPTSCGMRVPSATLALAAGMTLLHHAALL